MYFGNRDGYLRDIEALDIGYVMRVRRFAEEEDSHPLLPVAFKDHIIGTLAPERSVESTWGALIRKNAAGEREPSGSCSNGHGWNMRHELAPNKSLQPTRVAGQFWLSRVKRLVPDAAELALGGITRIAL